jgi:hypothetical protein
LYEAIEGVVEFDPLIIQLRIFTEPLPVIETKDPLVLELCHNIINLYKENIKKKKIE